MSVSSASSANSFSSSPSIDLHPCPLVINQPIQEDRLTYGLIEAFMAQREAFHTSSLLNLPVALLEQYCHVKHALMISLSVLSLTSSPFFKEPKDALSASKGDEKESTAIKVEQYVSVSFLMKYFDYLTFKPLKETKVKVFFDAQMDELKKYRALLKDFVDPIDPDKSQKTLLPCEVENHFSLEEHTFLGRGTFGHVYRCKVLSPSPQSLSPYVAIKKSHAVFERSRITHQLLRELKLLRLLSHENIISMKMVLPPIGYLFNDVSIVFECMEADLSLLIRTSAQISESHVQYFMFQILRGLEYLHSADIVHRDLKPGNILINADSTTKIADFGAARLLPSSKLFDPFRLPSIPAHENKILPEAPILLRQLSTQITTPVYKAPEFMLNEENYTTAVDIWSLGCIFYLLLQKMLDPLKKPVALFPSPSEEEHLAYIFTILGTPTASDLSKLTNDHVRKELAKIPFQAPINLQSLLPDVNPQAIDLLSKLLKFDPNSRLSASEALKHPYLADLEDHPNSLFLPEKLKEKEWEFEKNLKLSRRQYRSLILKEILIDHPHLRTHYDPLISF